MSDELHRKIVEGLSGYIDGDRFEECAVDLLQPIYKGLVPVKGGCDDGRDGYFFDLVGRSGPLVCTTSDDVSGNLRRNLQKYVETGHKGRSVVVATSHALTSKRRNNLEKVAEKAGFSVLQIHDQSDFAGKLYHNKRWLKELLNIESNQQALSKTSVTNRPIFNTLVRGRDDLADWLSTATGDVLIVGQPGSGKTFAARSYAAQNEGFFVVSEDGRQIAAEVRDKQPRFLIVDDAHLKPELLQTLRQIREDTGAEFRIVATSWLAHRDVVRKALSVPDGAVFELKLLSRDTILQIIRDCGVRGPDPLLRQMVTQAEGKPGLAATLCQLVIAGGIQDVYVGEALGKHIVALFKKEVDNNALDLLAVAALGGDSGISLEAAAEILKVSAVVVQRWASELRFGGVIKEIGPDRISVRPPPLRSYLVKQHFFGEGGNIDAYRYLPLYPKTSDVADVILRVALTGGKVDREKLYHLIEETRSPDLFGGYARLGKREARRVIDEHPDKALRAARNLLDICPEGILPLMLDAAVGDDHALHSNPEHPMRIVQDWCKGIDYDNTVLIGNRDLLLDVLSVWRGRLSQDKVTAQTLAAIFSPRIECLRSDPGSGRRCTLVRGHLGAKDLRHLIDLLPGARECFMVRSTDGLKELVGLLHEWVYEMPMPGEKIDVDQHSLLREGSSIILDYINEAATGRPGIQTRLEEYARVLGRRITYEKDVDYETIFPLREGDLQTWQRVAGQQREAALLLAASYLRLDPTDAIGRLSRCSKEAHDTGSAWPDYTGDIVSYLADHVSSPGEWAYLSVRGWDNANLSYPLLARYYAANPTEAEGLLMEALEHPSHRSAAAQVIVKRPFAKDILWDKAYPVLKDMAWWVYGIVARREVDEETILALLDHPSDGVAMMAAAALEQACDGIIPPACVDLWEAALISYPLANGPDDSCVGTALKRHPDVIVRWLMARVAEDTERNEESLVEIAKTLIPELSEDQKEDVIRALQNTSSSKLLAGQLVGTDSRLFECLLGNPNAAAYRLHVLSDVVGPVWRDFAEIAVKAGCDDASIESASMKLVDGWTGEASQHSLELRMGFKDGLDSSELRVVAMAQRYMDFYQERSEAELKKEEDGRIYDS